MASSSQAAEITQGKRRGAKKTKERSKMRVDETKPPQRPNKNAGKTSPFRAHGTRQWQQREHVEQRKGKNPKKTCGQNQKRRLEAESVDLTSNGKQEKAGNVYSRRRSSHRRKRGENIQGGTSD